MAQKLKTRLMPQSIKCMCRQCALKKRQADADARPSTDSLRPAAANARLSPANARPSPLPFLGMPLREAVRRGLLTKRRATSSILKSPHEETDGPSTAKRPATETALAVYYGLSRRFLEYLQKSLMLIHNLF
jgi:hypothetical protein